MSLLDSAKSYRTKQGPKPKITKEDIELVIAWCLDEVRITQVAKAKKIKPTNAYRYLAIVCREIISSDRK